MSLKSAKQVENTIKDVNVKHLIARRSIANALKEEFHAWINVNVKIAKMENVMTTKLPSSHKTSKMNITV